MSGPKVCPQCGEEYALDQRFCPKDGTTLLLQDTTGDLVGAVIADRYHVLRKLGEGGMGQVYLAEHVKIGRKSALKVMNPGMVKDADSISRFNREASNASRINHPHVADVYDFGETDDGIIYLAMEFVDGPSLTKLIEEQGGNILPPSRTATIIRQAADALAVAHEMGIVHRDLKPDNIMIARNRDGSDCVKIVDFGIAKAAGNAAQKVTKTGLVVGTPEYMSPEQLAADKLDGRSDIYALGLVAFNLLTGRLPFPADTVQESMIMRLTERPRRLGEMRPEIGWTPEVQAVLDRALERDVAARYRSASDFGRDFAGAIERMMAPGGGAGSAPPRVSQTKAMEAVPAGSASSAPSAASAVPVAATLPPTRVHVSRSRNTRLMAGAGGVILVAALVGGALVMMNDDASAGRNGVTGAGNTASQSGNAVKPEVAAFDVDAALDSLYELADIQTGSAATARQALNGLDVLQNRLATDDQTVLAALVRASALVMLEQTAEACKTLAKVRQMKSKYEPRVRLVLQHCP